MCRILSFMRVLVVTASKHGSTQELGDVVADQLRAAGHDVRCAGAADDLDLDVDAAVVGSAIYGARVMSAGKEVAERLTRAIHGPVWLFAVGLKSITKDPFKAAGISPAVDGYRGGRYPIFGGVVEAEKLSVAETALIGALGATNRDLRDTEMVRAWGQALACQLEGTPQGSSSTLPVV